MSFILLYLTARTHFSILKDSMIMIFLTNSHIINIVYVNLLKWYRLLIKNHIFYFRRFNDTKLSWG